MVEYSLICSQKKTKKKFECGELKALLKSKLKLRDDISAVKVYLDSTTITF